MAETSRVKGEQPFVPRHVSRTYPSPKFVFEASRFVACEAKATKRPFLLNTGSELAPLGVAPFTPTEIAWLTPGGPGLTTKETAFDVAVIKKSEFSTCNCTVPGEAISAAEICTVNCVALTNVVGGLLKGVMGLLRTVSTAAVPELKLLPFTVSAYAGPPAVTLVGEMDVMEGVEGGGVE